VTSSRHTEESVGGVTWHCVPVITLVTAAVSIDEGSFQHLPVVSCVQTRTNSDLSTFFIVYKNGAFIMSPPKCQVRGCDKMLSGCGRHPRSSGGEETTQVPFCPL
jgi:hypothetical protein